MVFHGMCVFGHSINKKARNYAGLLTLLECGGTVFGGGGGD